MAFIEKRGTTYRVRYREGSKNRSRTFDRKGDASRFVAIVEHAKRNGGIPIHDGGMALEEFCIDWLLNRESELAPKTHGTYRTLLRAHVTDYIGHLPIGEIGPRRLEEWKRERLEAGAGRTSIGQTITLLKQIFDQAVLMEMIGRNPAAPLKRPKPPPKKQIFIPNPEQLETMRRWFLKQDRPRDATFISILALAGVRPGEARRLRWDDFNERVMHVYATKTDAHRRVQMTPLLFDDLTAWKAIAPSSPYVFARRDGGHWEEGDYKNWQRRWYEKARKVAGLPTGRPYDLRHMRVSYLIRCGMDVVQIAQQLGHKPSMTLDTYAHVIDDPPPGDPNEWISRSRTHTAPKKVRDTVKRTSPRPHVSPAISRRSRRGDSNPWPLHYEARAGLPSSLIGADSLLLMAGISPERVRADSRYLETACSQVEPEVVA